MKAQTQYQQSYVKRHDTLYTSSELYKNYHVPDVRKRTEKMIRKN